MNRVKRYTQGPWTAFNCANVYPDDGDREARRHIAEVTPDGVETSMCDITWEEHCANLCLISAAPELLEALEVVWNKILSEQPKDSYLRQKAESAMDKAYGEDQS